MADRLTRALRMTEFPALADQFRRQMNAPDDPEAFTAAVRAQRQEQRRRAIEARKRGSRR